MPDKDPKIEEYLNTLFGSEYISFKLEKRVSKNFDRVFPGTRPLVGGLAIDQGICSAAFSAKDFSGNYFYITAGHCAQQNASPVTVKQGADSIGTLYSSGAYNGYWNDSGADVAAIAISSSNKSYKDYDGNIIDDEELFPVYGQIVCLSGRTSGTICGTVSNIGGTYTDDNNIHLKDQVFYTVTGAMGDSGGLVL